jgi:hypothetical protein
MNETKAQVRSLKARFAWSAKGALEKTLPLESGETVLLDSDVQMKVGRHSARMGRLRLTDRRLIFMVSAMLSSGRVIEVPRSLIRGVERVMVGVPLGGGTRNAISIDYESEPGDRFPFWGYDSVKTAAVAGTGNAGAVARDIEKRTEALYVALRSALYPSADSEEGPTPRARR